MNRENCCNVVGHSVVNFPSVQLTGPRPSRIYQIQFELACLLSSEELSKQLSPIIEHVYNPIDYAKDCYINFLQKYINSCKRLMFLGMNPGPWGMMQTGVRISEQLVGLL